MAAARARDPALRHRRDGEVCRRRRGGGGLREGAAGTQRAGTIIVIFQDLIIHFGSKILILELCIGFYEEIAPQAKILGVFGSKMYEFLSFWE